MAVPFMDSHYFTTIDELSRMLYNLRLLFLVGSSMASAQWVIRNLQVVPDQDLDAWERQVIATRYASEAAAHAALPGEIQRVRNRIAAGGGLHGRH